MNTKAGLGVSPIISVSFSVSSIWSHNFGNITLVLYTCFILVEVVLHSILLRRGKLPGGMGRTILLLDALQFPLSLVFTRFLNWFSVWLPDLPTDCLGTFWGTLPGQVVFLAFAIVFTGIGAALSLDITNVAITTSIGLLSTGHLVGIGLGTILSMIGVGRVIALFNHLCFQKTLALAGLQPS